MELGVLCVTFVFPHFALLRVPLAKNSYITRRYCSKRMFLMPRNQETMYPLVMTNSLLLKMTIEIVDFPSYKMVIFNSYVKLPEGKDTIDLKYLKLYQDFG